MRNRLQETQPNRIVREHPNGLQVLLLHLVSETLPIGIVWTIFRRYLMRIVRDNYFRKLY